MTSEDESTARRRVSDEELEHFETIMFIAGSLANRLAWVYDLIEAMADPDDLEILAKAHAEARRIQALSAARLEKKKEARRGERASLKGNAE